MGRGGVGGELCNTPVVTVRLASHTDILLARQKNVCVGGYCAAESGKSKWLTNNALAIRWIHGQSDI